MEELVIKVDVPVPAVGEARLVRGGARTGKTQRLIGRVCELMDAGVEPSDVLAVFATPDAAERFARRLIAARPDACGVRVLSAREVELSVLADPRAKARTGREPRLLMKFERDILMEDLKVGGTVGRRLRELLKFLRRSMTEFADEDGRFLIDGDEVDAMTRIKTVLAMTGGVLDCELPELAAQCLRDVPGLRDAFSRPHVVVDDYQLLCRASQVMTSFLARETLWVASDPDGCIEVFEPYPYAAGLAEFLASHPGAQVEDLRVSNASRAVLGAVNGLRLDTDVGCAPLSPDDCAKTGSARAVGCRDASEELRCVAGSVRDALAAMGAEREAVAEGAESSAGCEVFVCVPNRLWAKNVVKALSRCGIASVSAYDSELPAGGGFGENGGLGAGEGSLAARVLTLLLLAGDPNDGVAWRSWCGFGSYLAQSGVFDMLRDRADRSGATLAAMLDEMSSSGTEARGGEGGGVAAFHGDLERVIAAYREGLACIDALKGLRGEALLQAAARAAGGSQAIVPMTLRSLLRSDGNDRSDPIDACELRKRILRRLEAPCVGDSGARVLVGPVESGVGTSPRAVVCCGLVNGFLPGHDYFESTKTVPGKMRAARSDALRRAYTVFGRARDSLTCTYFTSIDLETAGRLDLKAERIFVEEGRRMATLSPSIVLEAAGLVG